MTPEELEALVNSGDPAQIRQAQQFLKNAGIYQGSIDGDAGNLTSTAVEAYKAAQSQNQGPSDNELRQQELEMQQQDRQRQQQLEEARRRVGALEAEGNLEAARDLALEEGLADEAQRIGGQIEQTEAESPYAVARRAGANAAWIPGVAIGRGMGAGANRLADKAQESRNLSLRTAAENRLSGLSTREGALSATERAGALPPRNAILRTAGRMAPHALLGGAMAGKGALTYFGVDEDDPRVQQDIDTAIGLGAIGAGSGLVERGVQYAKNPGVSPDAGDISIIESKQLRRNAGQNRMLGGPTIEGQAAPVQDTSRRVEAQPAQAADDVEATTKARSNALYDTMTRDQLRDQARKARLPTSGSKRALADRIAAHDRPIKGRVSRAASKAGDAASRAFLPATVGAMAADAAYNAAEAGQGAVEPGTGMRAEGDGTNRMLAATGGAAGGTAAGYGIQRGLEKAGEVAGRYAPGAMRLAGRALPVAGAGLTAYDAYRTFQDNPPEPGPKYPTTRDVSSAYSDYMGYSGETQGEEDAGFERDMEDLVSMMDQLP